MNNENPDVILLTEKQKELGALYKRLLASNNSSDKIQSQIQAVQNAMLNLEEIINVIKEMDKEKGTIGTTYKEAEKEIKRREAEEEKANEKGRQYVLSNPNEQKDDSKFFYSSFVITSLIFGALMSTYMFLII